MNHLILILIVLMIHQLLKQYLSVPSPVTASCAVAVRAINAAVGVGCCICISFNNVKPSFDNFNCPAPPTNNFNVPVGPKLLFNTFRKPTAADVLTFNSYYFDTTSAFGDN